MRFTTTQKKAANQANKNNNNQHRDVWQKMGQIILSFFKIGEIMKKFINDDEEDEHFGDELLKLNSLNVKITEFNKLLDSNKAECEQYRQQFIEFEHLYKRDRNKE